MKEEVWGSEIDPNYEPDPNFVIENRKPDPPK